MGSGYWRLVAGVLLVLAGVLLLLQNLGVMAAEWDAVWAIVFLLGGLAFLGFLITGEKNWWAAIPGFTLIGLGSLIGLEAIAPTVASSWGGGLFLGSIGLGFLVIYAMRREFWWAIIPAGVLLTLGLVAAVDQSAGGPEGGAIFFFGLALTFGVLYLIPTREGRRMTWALIPAVILFALGIVTGFAATGISNYIWPAILILAGAYLLLRNLRAR